MENLGTIFSHHVGSDRLAVIDLRDPEHPEEVSYDELDRSCDGVARGLTRRGLGAGDRIGILALNRIAYLEVLFGALRAGCIPVPINVKLTADTVRFIIHDAGIACVFLESAWAPLVPDGVQCIDLDTDYEDFTDPGPFDPIAVSPLQVSMQPYTSGTTGRPKGVLLSHFGQDWAARALVEFRRLKADDRILISAPFFHKNALVAIKSAMLPGACLVILPRFSAAASIEAIDRYKCTMLTGVPTMLHLVLSEKDLLEQCDISSVRTVSMGSAPASDTLLQGIEETFPKAAVQLNYGITEGGPIMLGWYHPDGQPRPVASVGYPMPECEFRFENGAHEREGELVVRNPGVALGYHNLPEASEESFRDGWFRTGDILRRDEDGWFFFMGRVDDMFVCGGENIYPGEIETLLETHPEIAQAAVLPFQHEIKGEVPYAFVVREARSRLDEASVKTYALENGPAYAHPRRVLFLTDLPLTGTNKIDRAALRALSVNHSGL